jgi:uncharacterized protein (TIGR03435 family)
VKHLVALLCAACGVLGQTAPRFEAADVHASGPAMNTYTLLSGGVLRGTRYDLRKATMLDLITIAYHVQPETVVGGPNWLEFDRFDIAAKAPANTSPEALRLMLPTLLAERFGLVMHRDTRPMAAYELETGKGKPKMTQADGTATADCEYQQLPPGNSVTARRCRDITMQLFAERLRGMADDYITTPVVDATGLEGGYDFDLRWHQRSLVLPAGAQRLTIFDAIEKQLGLSLVLHEVPQPVLAIDRVNEKPTPNAPDITQSLPPRQVEFEAADLKPSPPEQPNSEHWFRVKAGGELEVVDIPLQTLMLAAWDVDYSKPERIANLPKWTESARFTIHAKPSAEMRSAPVRGLGFPDDETRLMLRTLLVERFGIQWHSEDLPVEAYSLRGGKPKMKRGDASKRTTCNVARTVANDPRDMNPLLSELLDCRNVTMAQFAMKLQELEPDDFTWPLEDATGLSGTWDFLLGFSPRGLVGQKNPDGTPNGAIPIGEAISKQLGLKLERRKRALPVIVIDRMEEKPTGN